MEARPGDEATVTELDLRLDEWASAELKSVAADFYHALILFCKGKALKIAPNNSQETSFYSRHRSQKSFIRTLHWNLVNLVKSYHGIIERPRLNAQKQTELQNELYDE